MAITKVNATAEKNAFENAVYGKDVRSSLVSLTDKLVSSVNNNSDEVETTLDASKAEISALKSSVNTTNTSVTQLRTDLTSTQSQLNTAKSDISSLKTSVNTTIPTSISQLRTDISTVQTGLNTAKNELTQADEKIKSDLREVIFKDEASGNFIQVDNSANFQIQNLTVYGRSTQDGTPSPENPVEIVNVVNPKVNSTGKNLLDLEMYKKVAITYNLHPTRANIEWLDNGFKLTANGSDGYTNYVSGYFEPCWIPVKAGDKYTLSWENKERNSGYTFIFKCTPGKDPIVILNVNTQNQTSVTFTIPNGTEHIFYRFGVTTAGETNTYTNIQLERNSTATAYEPFRGTSHTVPFTIRGIRVESDGNYIDSNGQQWLADEWRLNPDGSSTLIQNVYEYAITGNEETIFTPELYEGDISTNAGYVNREHASLIYVGDRYKILCNELPYEIKCWERKSVLNGYTVNGGYQIHLRIDNTVLGITSDMTSSQKKNAHIAYVKSRYNSGNPIKVVFHLANPITTNYTKEQTNAILNTYNPITNIYNSQGADIDVTYAVDPAYLVPDSSGAHNAIYRGKYLGSYVTDEQWAAISNGTFKDLFIGDYWKINNVNWVIAGFDYYYQMGDTSCDTHHVVIVPAGSLYNHVMNDTNTTNGGYVGSKMYTEGLEQAKAIIKSAFGESHILSHRVYLCNAITSGRPSAGAWFDSDVELMTENIVYGGPVMQQMPYGGTLISNYRCEKIQLPYFRYKTHYRGAFWLRDIANASNFCFAHYRGLADADGASNSVGVRPLFLIS